MRDVIAQALSAKGRGSQTRLADAVGVRAQTVNKWVKGANAPEMESWPAIEQFLDLAPGTLAEAAGITPLDAGGGIPPAVRAALREMGDELRQLQAEVAELRDEVRGSARSSDPARPARRSSQGTTT